MTINEFLSPANACLNAFSSWAQSMMPNAAADHIGYKCASSEEFESIRRTLESGSEFIYQSIISKRRIAIVKLHAPCTTPLGPIAYLELSDQKPDGSQKSGFDHLEIYPKTGTVEELAAMLTAKGIAFEKTERPHHTTYDAKIAPSFSVRLEAEPLMEKIISQEIRPS